jgi:hypothetical protein
MSIPRRGSAFTVAVAAGVAAAATRCSNAAGHRVLAENTLTKNFRTGRPADRSKVVLHKFSGERLAFTLIDGDLRVRLALVSRGLGESGMSSAPGI